MYIILYAMFELLQHFMICEYCGYIILHTELRMLKLVHFQG